MSEMTTPDPLDRRHFVLSAENWDRFVKRLDEPPEPNEQLKRLMRKKPIWETSK